MQPFGYRVHPSPPSPPPDLHGLCVSNGDAEPSDQYANSEDEESKSPVLSEIFEDRVHPWPPSPPPPDIHELCASDGEAGPSYHYVNSEDEESNSPVLSEIFEDRVHPSPPSPPPPDIHELCSSDGEAGPSDHYANSEDEDSNSPVLSETFEDRVHPSLPSPPPPDIHELCATNDEAGPSDRYANSEDEEFKSPVLCEIFRDLAHSWSLSPASDIIHPSPPSDIHNLCASNDEAEASDQCANVEDEESNSPVLCEIFTTHRSLDSAELERALTGFQQGHACQAIRCNIPVVVLEYHVPMYRPIPGLGFTEIHDAFSSLTWRRRQEQYAGRLGRSVVDNMSHIIVQGRMNKSYAEFQRVNDLSNTVPRFPGLLIHKLEYRQVNYIKYWKRCFSKLYIFFDLQLNVVEDVIPDWEIMVALYEIETRPTPSIPLSYYVVRDLIAAYRTHKSGPKYEIPIGSFLALPEGLKIDNCGIVVFLQCPITMHIWGATNIRLSSDQCPVVQATIA